MKIGIFTLWQGLNYGGVLQNYALQKVLKDMGHDVYTIDRTFFVSSFFRILSFLKRNFQHYILRKDVPTMFYVGFTKKEFLYVCKNTRDFITKYNTTTFNIKSNKKLYLLRQYKFDAYIVGSDQVWLKTHAPYSFLSFIEKDENVKRVAYAASFGRNNWTYNKKLTDKCRTLIKKFNSISVREKAAVELCKKYLGSEAEWVLDPTLLLDCKDYIHLIEQKENLEVDKNILMTYILDNDTYKKDLINFLCNKLNLTEYDLKCKFASQREEKSLCGMQLPSISQWLRGFYNAKFVITDSYHGTIMAIIFNKQFLTISNHKRGQERFLSLLSLLGLEYRLIDFDVDYTNYLNSLPNIDYNRINDILKREKVKSYNFLSESLK